MLYGDIATFESVIAAILVTIIGTGVQTSNSTSGFSMPPGPQQNEGER